MPKVLSIDGTMSNAEVLTFLQKKRAHIAQEDQEDAKANRNLSRPPNFLKSLAKHERHLQSEYYPYATNPSAYATKAKQIAALKQFAELHTARVQIPARDAIKERVRRSEITEKQGEERLRVEMNKKELTENEMLMIHNLAPTNVEFLQPMIEQAEERFEREELEIIVKNIMETYRAEEGGTKQTA